MSVIPQTLSAAESDDSVPASPAGVSAESGPEASVDEIASEDGADESAIPRRRRSQVLTTVRQLWPFLRPQRRRLALASGVSLALTATEVATPILVGLFIDSLLARLHGTPNATAFNSKSLLALLGGLAVLRGLLVWRFRSLSGQIGERVAARLRDTLWGHLQVLPLDYTRRRGVGQLLLRFIGDTRALQRLVTNGLVRLSQELLLGAAVLAALAVINGRMALAVALILPVYGLIFWRLNPELQQASRATRRRRSRLSSYLHERIAGMPLIKAFARQEAEAASVKALNSDLARRGARHADVDGRLQGLTTATVGIAGALVLALAAREVSAARLSGGSLVAFYALLGLLLPVFQRVVTANRYFQEGYISVQRLMDTLAVQPEGTRAHHQPDLNVRRGEVVARQLSYSLKDGRAVLTDVSFCARRGEMIAIVGANGAGKSTLMELLLRFRKPSGGGLFIDGCDIAEVSLSSLRRQVGLVGRDWMVFDGTVGENIAYGLPAEASPERIERAMGLAGTESFIAALPQGLQTRVGRGGCQLSGGQRQLIALARALAIDPPILLLDDALAGLDADAEAALIESLHALAERMTVIFTAHRLPARLSPGRIYRLLEGRLVLSQLDQEEREGSQRSGRIS